MVMLLDTAAPLSNKKMDERSGIVGAGRGAGAREAEIDPHTHNAAPPTPPPRSHPQPQVSKSTTTTTTNYTASPLVAGHRTPYARSPHTYEYATAARSPTPEGDPREGRRARLHARRPAPAAAACTRYRSGSREGFLARFVKSRLPPRLPLRRAAVRGVEPPLAACRRRAWRGADLRPPTALGDVGLVSGSRVSDWSRARLAVSHRPPSARVMVVCRARCGRASRARAPRA